MIDKLLSNPAVIRQLAGQLPEGTRAGVDRVAELAAEPVTRPEYLRPIFDLAGDRHGVPPQLLEAVAARTTRFNTGHRRGLMDLDGSAAIPAAKLAARDPGSVVELVRQVEQSAEYLADLRRVHGSWPGAVGAYVSDPHIAEDVLGRFSRLLLSELPAGFVSFLRELMGAADNG